MVRANLHGACVSCNGKRNDKNVSDLAVDDAEALEFFR
jgi:hypothetical protein